MSTPSTALTRESSVLRRSILRPIAACLLGIAGLFALDALLFRTPLYREILEPSSSTGQFEWILRRERNAQNQNGDNMVITLGDSRFAYSPRLSNELTSKTGYVFRQAGIAGTGPRSWYYMLRDLDPTGRRYRAVVLGVADYNDEDKYYNPADDIRELHYVVERLRWTDVLDFAASFELPEARWQALRGGLLKGVVLQKDILAFLSHPQERIATVAQGREGYEQWTYTYEEVTRNMNGLQIDWSSRTATFPPEFDQAQRDTIGSEILDVAPQTGSLGRYRRHWLGRILERYRDSRTKIVFIRLPRGPIPRPERMAPKVASAIREFAARPNVLLADEHAFDSLEQPELFKDGIHLNRAGIARFSPMLAEEVGRMIAR